MELVYLSEMTSGLDSHKMVEQAKKSDEEVLLTFFKVDED
jgi:hypothetical protein